MWGSNKSPQKSLLKKKNVFSKKKPFSACRTYQKCFFKENHAPNCRTAHPMIGGGVDMVSVSKKERLLDWSFSYSYKKYRRPYRGPLSGHMVFFLQGARFWGGRGGGNDSGNFGFKTKNFKFSWKIQFFNSHLLILFLKPFEICLKVGFSRKIGNYLKIWEKQFPSKF